MKPKLKMNLLMGMKRLLMIYELDGHDAPVSSRYTMEYLPDEKITNNFRAPKVAKPDDPRYSTPEQDKERARRRAREAKRAAKEENK